MTIRLPSVEARLGTPFDGADAAAVLRLLGLPETEDLDFKRELYKDTADLCVDVAAMANSGGGVIVIGLDEQGTGVAAAATPVALSDSEELRMRQAVASTVAPLPAWNIVAVHHPAAGSGMGFYLLAVAGTDQAPHALRKGPSLKYPARNGTSTRYLTEHEVADAYRNRFDGARARLDRLIAVHHEVQLRNHGSPYVPWLTVAMVPTGRARLSMSTAAVAAADRWLASVIDGMPFGTNFHEMHRNVVAGLRCFEVTDPAVSLGLPTTPAYAFRAAAHLGLDGAAAVGVNLVTDEKATRNEISEERLFVHIVSALQVTVGFATSVAGLFGDAMVRMTIPAPSGLPVANSKDQSLVLVAGTSGSDLSQVQGSRPFNSLTVREFVSEHTIDLDAAAASAAGMASAAVPLLTDVVNAFGVAEPRIVGRSGELRLARWHAGYRQGISAWATTQGVPAV